MHKSAKIRLAHDKGDRNRNICESISKIMKNYTKHCISRLDEDKTKDI